MTARDDLLRRLEAQLHEALAEGSQPHEIDGFRVHLWPTPDPFYRNVAVPVAPAADGPAAIGALRDLFARHDRRARVEFFAELWPGLERALQAAGFVAESQAPVMARRAGPLPLPDPTVQVELLDARTPAPVLHACLERAAAAFHEPAAILAPGELERMQEGLARGSLRSAVVRAGGRPVAGASLAGRGPVAELLGVWTDACHRRRGFARAVCGRLLAGFFAGGGEVAWLTAGSPESLSLYRSLGFEACGTHLDYADGLAAAAAPAAVP